MKKLLFVLITVLLLGTAVASFASRASHVEGVGLTIVEDTSTSTPNMSGAVLDESILIDPLRGSGLQGLNLCTLQCRTDYIDCKEICACPECDTAYQACLANC